MKKLALAMAVLMGSAVAMPAMADNYWGQQRAAANHARHAQMKQVRHDRQMARKMHRQEVRKIRHDRRVARQHIRHDRRMMHHQPAMVAPAVVAPAVIVR